MGEGQKDRRKWGGAPPSAFSLGKPLFFSKLQMVPIKNEPMEETKPEIKRKRKE